MFNYFHKIYIYMVVNLLFLWSSFLEYVILSCILNKILQRYTFLCNLLNYQNKKNQALRPNATIKSLGILFLFLLLSFNNITFYDLVEFYVYVSVVPHAENRYMIKPNDPIKLHNFFVDNYLLGVFFQYDDDINNIRKFIKIKDYFLGFYFYDESSDSFPLYRIPDNAMKLNDYVINGILHGINFSSGKLYPHCLDPGSNQVEVKELMFCFELADPDDHLEATPPKNVLSRKALWKYRCQALFNDCVLPFYEYYPLKDYGLESSTLGNKDPSFFLDYESHIDFVFVYSTETEFYNLLYYKTCFGSFHII